MMSDEITAISGEKPAFWRRFWPSSMAGQMMLLLAMALLFAQLINLALLWRAQNAHDDDKMAVAAAARLIAADDRVEQNLYIPKSNMPRFLARQQGKSDRKILEKEFEKGKAQAHRPPLPPYMGDNVEHQPEEGDRNARRFRRIRLDDDNPISNDMTRNHAITEDVAEILDHYDIDYQQVMTAIIPRKPKSDKPDRARGEGRRERSEAGQRQKRRITQ